MSNVFARNTIDLIVKHALQSAYEGASALLRFDDLANSRMDESERRDLSLGVSAVTEAIDSALEVIRELDSRGHWHNADVSLARIDHVARLNSKAWKAFSAFNRSPKDGLPGPRVASDIFRCVADLQDWGRGDEAGQFWAESGGFKHWANLAPKGVA